MNNCIHNAVNISLFFTNIYFNSERNEELILNCIDVEKKNLFV